MKTNRLLLPLFVIILACSTYAQDAEAPEGPSPESVYADLVAKLKAGDTSVDFKSARIAYSKTGNASSMVDVGASLDLIKAMVNKRYKVAIRIAEGILKDMYVAPQAHHALSVSYRALGDTRKADFHKAIYDGLIRSIMTGADGKTPKTAFMIITFDEAYDIMEFLNYSVSLTRAERIDGHNFQVITGTDKKTQAPIKLYFNADIPDVTSPETKDEKQ